MKRVLASCLIVFVWLTAAGACPVHAGDPTSRKRSHPEPIVSSWDDLLEGIDSPEKWQEHRRVLKRRYLELLRDDRKPARVPLELKVHETVNVDGIYERQLISYAVEAGERGHAYLGIPLQVPGKKPAIVVLHQTHPRGKDEVAGLEGEPSKACFDHVCRRGYVAIAPDHFVAGHRTPAEGAYETGKFHEKHPEWTAVGKFTYEHQIAIDVLAGMEDVDPEQMGCIGHSLGGHGSMFLAAYDERIKAAAGNCSASFFRQNSGVEHWSRDHWYVYFKHMRPGLVKGELPPIDFHEIMALIAPRAYLDISGLNDGDRLTQRQRGLMLLKVMDVYELEGHPENFSFYMHGRGHSLEHESRELLYGFLDAHLKPKEATRKRLVTK